MGVITIDGARPWDGSYDLDFRAAPLTVREWGLVKRHSGYMPGTIGQGLAGSDLELINVFAVIAIIRSGKAEHGQAAALVERLLDVEGGRITFDISADPEDDGAEDDAGPPALSSNGNTPSSGRVSTTSSGRSDSTPEPTGTPASATSLSAPVTSAI